MSTHGVPTLQTAPSRRSLWSKVLMIVAMIIIGWGGIFFGGRWLAGEVAMRLPYSVDRDLGGALSKAILDDVTVCTNPELTEAVDEVVQRLAAGLPEEQRTLSVVVVDDELVNAFALPGGYIILFTGLLQAIEAPEELIGVLGHEIGHAAERHGMRAIARRLWFGILQSLFLDGGAGTAGLMVDQAANLAALGFDRDQERAADTFGLDLMTRAGYAPGTYPAFFARLPDVAIPEWLSTHPDPTERAAELTATIASAPPVSPAVAPPALSRLQASCHPAEWPTADAPL